MAVASMRPVYEMIEKVKKYHLDPADVVAALLKDQPHSPAASQSQMLLRQGKLEQAAYTLTFTMTGPREERVEKLVELFENKIPILIRLAECGLDEDEWGDDD